MEPTQLFFVILAAILFFGGLGKWNKILTFLLNFYIFAVYLYTKASEMEKSGKFKMNKK